MGKQKARLQGMERRPQTKRSDDTVEREVARESAQEQQTRPARTIQELQKATLGLDGALHTFAEKFDLRIHERIVMLIHELEQRIGEYMKHPEYVQGLLSGQREEIAEMQAPILEELTPIIRELLGELQAGATTKKVYPTAEVLLTSLGSGEVEKMKHGVPHRDRIESFIGLLQRTVGFDVSQEQQHARIVITNPYERFTPNDQKRLKEQTERVITEVMATLSDEMGRGRALAEQKEDGDELDADQEAAYHEYLNYKAVVDWMKTEVKTLQGRMNERDARLYREHVNLLYGDPEDVTRRINGIEQLKQHSPEVVMRLFGVVPGSNIMDRTAAKSPLGDSIFQLGVYNAQQRLRKRQHQKMFGEDTLRRHIEGLTLLSIQQPELFYLNDEQMAEIGKQLVGEKKNEGDTTKENSGRLNRAKAALHATVGVLLPAYAMRVTLEEMTRNEDREFLLGRLRKCGPDEFVARIKALPPFMANDHEIVQIIDERILKRIPAEASLLSMSHLSIDQYVYPIKTAPELIHAIRFFYDQMYKRTNDSLKKSPIEPFLWETAGDEALLTEEFLEDIPQFGKDTFLKILDAHPAITKDQWLAWYEEMKLQREEVDQQTFGERAAIRARRGLLTKPMPASEIINDAFIRYLDATDIIKSKSQFFIVYGSPSTDVFLQRLEVSLQPKEAVILRAKTMSHNTFVYHLLQENSIHPRPTADLCKEALCQLEPKELVEEIEELLKAELMRVAYRAVELILTKHMCPFRSMKELIRQLDMIHAFCPEAEPYQQLLAEEQPHIFWTRQVTNDKGVSIVGFRVALILIDDHWNLQTTHQILLPEKRETAMLELFGVFGLKDIPLEQWEVAEEELKP